MLSFLQNLSTMMTSQPAQALAVIILACACIGAAAHTIRVASLLWTIFFIGLWFSAAYIVQQLTSGTVTA